MVMSLWPRLFWPTLYMIHAFSALTLLKGIRPVKTEWWGVWGELPTGQLMLLLLTVFCFSKIQIGFTFLVPAQPGSPGKVAV